MLLDEQSFLKDLIGFREYLHTNIGSFIKQGTRFPSFSVGFACILLPIHRKPHVLQLAQQKNTENNCALPKNTQESTSTMNGSWPDHLSKKIILIKQDRRETKILRYLC